MTDHSHESESSAGPLTAESPSPAPGAGPRRIQQLSTSVINKIAAGEVIERPASVVKELLENSLDAGATRIEVDVVAGGAELIRVTDDGGGIHPDDMLLAVTSHATSKIRGADDLFVVQTMGFRGEALASIAEVSRLRLRSRQAGATEGSELAVDLGIVADPRPCGCPVGTTIEIRNLFENTPVRRKFMKAPATEFGHISEQFTRIAVAHPRMHLVLRHQGKLVYELPPAAGLIERLEYFYGRELADQLISVESENQGTRIWGYVGHPSFSKPTRKQQSLYLNGRWIQDRTLQHALTEAYRGLLMVGRQPVACLFIDLAADQVDVNVHPTKIEVRFRDSQVLFRQLLSMIRSKFLQLNLTSELRVATETADPGLFGDATGGLSGNASYELKSGLLPSGGGSLFRDVPARPPTSPERQQALQTEFAEWATSQLNQWTPERPPTRFSDDEVSTGLPRSPLGTPSGLTVPRTGVPEFVPYPPLPGRLTSVDAEGSVPLTPANDIADAVAEEAAAAGPAETSSFPPVASTAELSGGATGMFRAMQIHDCYLVVETPDGMSVIDQHALHERILYEQFRERVLSGAVISQKLLVPQPVEATAREAAILLDNAELLGTLGFGIEDFGGSTVLITRYPALLGRNELHALIKELADRLESEGQSPTRRDILDEMLHMMACKAAVKAGQRLSAEEIEALLAQRELCADSHHCPHGRPTVLNLSRAELDRQFGRLG